MVEHMRATIEALGGEYRFETPGRRTCDVADAADGTRRLRGVRAGGRRAYSRPTMSCWRSATARATPSRCCTARRRTSRPSRFSIGVRIEHPQSLIDRARFGAAAGHPVLGAADYKLVHHCRQRPHRLQLLHVPGRHRGRRHLRAGPRRHQRHEPVFAQRAQRQCRASSSASTRRRPTIPGDPLAGIAFQRHWEERAFAAGGGDLCRAGAAGRRFPGRPRLDRAGRGRAVLPPGVTPTDLAACLPDFAVAAIREALPAFERADRRLRHGRRGA